MGASMVVSSAKEDLPYKIERNSDSVLRYILLMKCFGDMFWHGSMLPPVGQLHI